MLLAVPVILLTARGDAVDVVVGLECGADDYVVKPVEPRVLDARVTAVLRLLIEFAEHPGQVLSGQVLLKRVRDYGFAGDSRLVDATVAGLRAEIEPEPADPVLLRTVRGFGYRLVKP